MFVTINVIIPTSTAITSNLLNVYQMLLFSIYFDVWYINSIVLIAIANSVPIATTIIQNCQTNISDNTIFDIASTHAPTRVCLK